MRPTGAASRGSRSAPLRKPKAPNDIWGIDFKGWFRTRDGVRCDPLTVTDLSSRFILSLVILPGRRSASGDGDVFACYGVPGAMRSAGTPFAGPGLLACPVVGDWVKGGIRLERIDPGKPFRTDLTSGCTGR